jgi:formamidopyrimidine-DNA glycosylase
MPELPEVETCRRGIDPHVCGQQVTGSTVRQGRLRWSVSEQITRELPGQYITHTSRRGKYLLLHATRGTVIIHLGMSGSIRMVNPEDPPRKHDHIDLIFGNALALRYHDPRRFGAMLWTDQDPAQHALLRNLGPEPLSDAFDGNYLFRRSRGRKVPIKSFIMDSQVVVGAGNIYANEALFLSGIRPLSEAGSLSRARCHRLATQIKTVIQQAIEVGGTTLRDFVGGDGQPGYFKQSLYVYGRGGETCLRCGSTLQEIRITQRSTVFCKRCQR